MHFYYLEIYPNVLTEGIWIQCPFSPFFQVKSKKDCGLHLKKWRKWALNPNRLRQYMRIYFQIVKVHKLYFFSYQLSQKIILAILVFFSIYTVKKKVETFFKTFLDSEHHNNHFQVRNISFYFRDIRCGCFLIVFVKKEKK